jgi:hypothetical protein
MRKNVGTVDRIIRVILGLGVTSLALVLDGSARWWALLALIPLGTAAVGNCPLYTLLRIRTCPAPQAGARS